jgi:hypothetical protein
MNVKFSVLLPASLTADAADLQQKTHKIGVIGRALAMFSVGDVCIYNDDDPKVPDQTAQAKLVTTILDYLETPQYLRKFLFPHMNELRYAGLLPPLRTPHHALGHEKTAAGSFREGVVVESSNEKSLVEAGLKKVAIVKEKLKAGTRCTLKIVEVGEESPIAVLADPNEITEYWGYRVHQAGSLCEGLNAMKDHYLLGTSRLGSDLYEAVKNIKDSKVGSLAVAFGGPYSGLFDICTRQGVDAKEIFGAIVNTVPQQRTATVRTEEALLATLALLNMLLR